MVREGQNVVRVSLSVVHPAVGVEAFVLGHGVVATGLDVNQVQHVRHRLDDSATVPATVLRHNYRLVCT